RVIFRSRRYTGLSSVHAPSASHNCSGVARNLSWAKAASAAGLVSPSASAFNMRLALTPSRSETRLDNLIWASSRSDSSWLFNRTRSRRNWYFLRVTVRHRRCSASGTKLSVSSRATSRFTKRSASTKSLLRPRRPRLDSACARCNVPDLRLAPSRFSQSGFQYLSSVSHTGFQYCAVDSMTISSAFCSTSHAANDRSCSGLLQTSAAQIGIRFRFQRRTQLQPASSCGHRFPLSGTTETPPGRERRACCDYFNQSRGLSPLPSGRQRRPIRSNTHAPDQTDGRSRNLH